MDKKAQRKGLLARVHIAPKELGMKCSEYRAALERFGVASAGDLGLNGLIDLDQYFQDLGWEPKKARGQKPAPVRPPNSGAGSGPGSDVRGQKYPGYLAKWKKLGYRAGMATAQQLAKIESDWDRLEAYWNKDGRGHRDAALRGFLVARFCTEDLRFLSFTKAGKMIEALKAIDVRCHRKSRIKQ